MIRDPAGTWGPLARVAAGILVFAAMTLIVGSLSEDVIRHEPLTAFDAAFSAWLHLHASPDLTSAMRVATFFGSGLCATAIAAAMAIRLWRKQRWYWLAALVVSVPGGALLNLLLKYAVHRARPQFADPLLSFSGYSFPSGHTMMASVLYGVIAAYACTETTGWSRRAIAIASASIMIALVAFSRIYLGAHYLSDVLAALAEGMAWLSICLTVLTIVWRRRTRPARPGRH
jgi:membrane-associated phospholipid phosphatase